MRYRFHVFVCENRRPPEAPRGSCAARGGIELRAALKAEVARRGLHAEVRVNGAGCLDACGVGPAIVVYPQGTWYGRVTVADVPAIVDHLAGGPPVERLRLAGHEAGTE